jgi:hypothetical protein
MTQALIGHTGFVGGNLASQAEFDACFNSKNIEDIAGQSFDLLVISGMPAAKWIANGDPEGDRRVLDRITGCLARAKSKVAVVMSTVDVYPVPIHVNEDTPIEATAQQPYGRHRLMLEQFVTERFAKSHILRLPGLFGPGLKKNAVYDLIHNNEVHKINSQGSFQFYDTTRLWADVQKVIQLGLRLVNMVTEPITIAEAAQHALGIEFHNDPGSKPARYDIRSKHAGLWGGSDGYLLSRQQVLDDLRNFVVNERKQLG